MLRLIKQIKQFIVEKKYNETNLLCMLDYKNRRHLSHFYQNPIKT